MAKPQIARAAETGTGSAPDSKVDSEPAKRAVAKHELLDAAGNVVEEEEKATGIRYTLLATGKSVDWQSGMEAGKPQTMIACFGAKTLATNEASQVRQKEGENGDQVGAIQERFELIATGKWVDRTGGVGAKVNLDTLAQAIVNVLSAAGKTVELADVRAKLEGDKARQSTARANPEIAAEYTKLMGRTIKSVDEVFAAL